MNGNSYRREPAGGALLRPGNPFRAGVITLASASVALLAGYQLAAQISRSFESATVPAPAALVQSAPAPTPVAAVPPPVDPIEELVLEVQAGDTLDSLFRATSLSLVDLTEILQLDVARKYLRVSGRATSSTRRRRCVLELGRELDIRSARIQRAVLA
jgi:hypothetical protein